MRTTATNRPKECFNPRPPRGGRPVILRAGLAELQFQSTPPARRATRLAGPGRHAQDVSIHAPRAEGDWRKWRPGACTGGFNPRPPRGGRPVLGSVEPHADAVSIHAPRAEGDTVDAAVAVVRNGFNPRPPRGGRLDGHLRREVLAEFQSTPPARRATRRGARQGRRPRVSIHAPRAEGDPVTSPQSASSIMFQSTPPARRATSSRCTRPRSDSFQSTPPARRATWRRAVMRRADRGFNPRPPRGGRLVGFRSVPPSQMFQSTPPARRATGSTTILSSTAWFQSTPPARRATLDRDVDRRVDGVSIHAPRAEGDRLCNRCHGKKTRFQSTPPARRATGDTGQHSL